MGESFEKSFIEELERLESNQVLLGKAIEGTEDEFLKRLLYLQLYSVKSYSDSIKAALDYTKSASCGDKNK